MAILTCPNCGIGVQPEDLICFRCGANLPHAPFPDDDIPSPTVSQQYIRQGETGARRRPSLVLLLGCQFVINHAGMLAPGLTHVRGATPRLAPDRRPAGGQ